MRPGPGLRRAGWHREWQSGGGKEASADGGLRDTVVAIEGQILGAAPPTQTLDARADVTNRNAVVGRGGIGDNR